LPNSSGTFLSADEDPTGALAEVEKKIAKATTIPRSNGEVLLRKLVIAYHVQSFFFSPLIGTVSY
jgi:hypothetical protein